MVVVQEAGVCRARATDGRGRQSFGASAREHEVGHSGARACGDAWRCGRLRARSRAHSEAVRHEVWRRDQGRCVDCGSRSNLELDHIIPWSEGGSNTARNLELRCESCNRKKARHLDGRTRGIGGSAPLLRAVSSDRGVAGASPAVMRLSRCRWPHRGGRLAGGAVDVRRMWGAVPGGCGRPRFQHRHVGGQSGYSRRGRGPPGQVLRCRSAPERVADAQ